MKRSQLCEAAAQELAGSCSALCYLHQPEALGSVALSNSALVLVVMKTLGPVSSSLVS